MIRFAFAPGFPLFSAGFSQIVAMRYTPDKRPSLERSTRPEGDAIAPSQDVLVSVSSDQPDVAHEQMHLRKQGSSKSNEGRRELALSRGSVPHRGLMFGGVGV